MLFGFTFQVIVPLDVALRLIEVVLHVNTAGVAIVNVGLMMFCVTVTLSIVIQPLVLVAVAEYLPGAVTVIGLPEKPVHATVPLDVALRLTEVVVQVSVPETVAERVGLVMF